MSKQNGYFPALNDVMAAEHTLREILSPTPLIHNHNLSTRYGAQIELKREDLQMVRSYKIRGAYNMIRSLSPEQRQRGIVCASAGNHAQGVALAAKKYGIPALICLPDGAPISKVEATKSYGAEVCMVKGVYDDAYKKAIELRDEKGYTFVHPFDDENVIAGQGTIGIEILEELPDADAVY